jgi:hypothetical protein
MVATTFEKVPIVYTTQVSIEFIFNLIMLFFGNDYAILQELHSLLCLIQSLQLKWKMIKLYEQKSHIAYNVPTHLFTMCIKRWKWTINFLSDTHTH